MSALFSTPKIPKPADPTAPPSLTDPQTRNEAANNAPNAAKGYGSTILTSGAGDTSTPTVAKKQLTGG